MGCILHHRKIATIITFALCFCFFKINAFANEPSSLKLRVDLTRGEATGSGLTSNIYWDSGIALVFNDTGYKVTLPNNQKIAANFYPKSKNGFFTLIDSSGKETEISLDQDLDLGAAKIKNSVIFIKNPLSGLRDDLILPTGDAIIQTEKSGKNAQFILSNGPNLTIKFTFTSTDTKKFISSVLSNVSTGINISDLGSINDLTTSDPLDYFKLEEAEIRAFFDPSSPFSNLSGFFGGGSFNNNKGKSPEQLASIFPLPSIGGGGSSSSVAPSEPKSCLGPVCCCHEEGSDPKLACLIESATVAAATGRKTLAIWLHGVGANPDDPKSTIGQALQLKGIKDNKCLVNLVLRWKISDSLSASSKKFLAFVNPILKKPICKWCKVIIIGHSAGGVIASKSVGEIDPNGIPVEVKTFGSPLDGHSPTGFLLGPLPYIFPPGFALGWGALAEIAAGISPFDPPAPGVNVEHYTTGAEDEEINPGDQDDNHVPGAKIIPTSETHSGVLLNYIESLVPKCPCQNLPPWVFDGPISVGGGDHLDLPQYSDAGTDPDQKNPFDRTPSTPVVEPPSITTNIEGGAISENSTGNPN